MVRNHGGKVDTTVTGPKTFKDAKGNDVTGLFAAGRMIKEFSGFTDDGSKTYFVEEGVIRTDLSGELKARLQMALLLRQPSRTVLL